MKLIFGLGNPGVTYQNNRHNAGFMALDKLSKRLLIPVQKKKRKALVGVGTVGGEKVLLIKPQTFMNNSGDCVLDFAAYYKVDSKDLFVIYDDVDLDVGVLRIRAFGGAGTHNGMRDILSKIMTEDFPRFRIGIGAPPPDWDLADYVLGNPQGEERKALDATTALCAEAVHHALLYGVESAMRYNGTPGQETMTT